MCSSDLLVVALSQSLGGQIGGLIALGEVLAIDEGLAGAHQLQVQVPAGGKDLRYGASIVVDRLGFDLQGPGRTIAIKASLAALPGAPWANSGASMQARRIVTRRPSLVEMRMVSPSPTETRLTACRTSGSGSGGEPEERRDGCDGCDPWPLEGRDPWPHSRSQGMPSPSPSIPVFPRLRDSMASSQVLKLEHRWAMAGGDTSNRKAIRRTARK